MPEIQIIKSGSIPRIPHIHIEHQSSIPEIKEITRTLPPTFSGYCMDFRNDGTKNNQLFIDDPTGNRINCPIPYYVPIQYNKTDLLPIKEAKPPTDIEQPKTETDDADIPEIPEKPKIECPDPKKNNPRIGDFNSAGTEKVTGYKLIEEECVILWTSTTKIEKYLPSLNTVSTTFTITLVATTAATLTPLLNKILKPLFKQVIGRVKKLLGKKGTKFSGKKPIKSKINKV